jgi:hypothetical protein
MVVATSGTATAGRDKNDWRSSSAWNNNSWNNSDEWRSNGRNSKNDWRSSELNNGEKMNKQTSGTNSKSEES